MSDELIIFGVLASIVFYELTDISPGGIIVPGYIALFLDEPYRIILTIGLSILTFGFVRVLSELTILFGKRRFAVYILTSFLLRFLLGWILGEVGIPLSAGLVIGYLVPGILAQEIDRQGFVKTVGSMLIVAVGLKLAMLGFVKMGKVQ